MYIFLEIAPPPPGISADVICGKNMQRRKEDENVKEKGGKTKDKGKLKLEG
jgi:hypothetical protein